MVSVSIFSSVKFEISCKKTFPITFVPKNTRRKNNFDGTFRLKCTLKSPCTIYVTKDAAFGLGSEIYEMRYAKPRTTFFSSKFICNKTIMSIFFEIFSSNLIKRPLKCDDSRYYCLLGDF